MSGKFDRQIKTAQRLIEKNGEIVKWRQMASTLADPDKPWNPADDTPVDTDVSICFVPVKDSSTRLFLAYLKGADAVVGRLAGIMGNVPFVPSLKDVVIRGDGSELSIVSIDLVSPNGQRILWSLEFNG